MRQQSVQASPIPTNTKQTKQTPHKEREKKLTNSNLDSSIGQNIQRRLRHKPAPQQKNL
jgi:hypothetical protein